MNGIGDALYWARGEVETFKMDETTLLSDGEKFVAWWWSQPIWKDPRNYRFAELRTVIIKYVAELDSSMVVDGSPDGGENWFPGNPEPVPVVEHHRGVRTVNVDFQWTQGHDPRFRICFTEPEIIIVKGFIAEFILRGSSRFERLTFEPLTA